MRDSLLFLLFLAGPLATAFASEMPHDLDQALKTAKEIYLATRRPSGEQSSVAPVWFMYEGGAIYFATAPHSYKARRIRRGSPVEVWVGSRTGLHFSARAELLKDGDLAERMGNHYRQKYWIARLGFFKPSRARVAAGKIAIVKLTPELPSESAP